MCIFNEYTYLLVMLSSEIFYWIEIACKKKIKTSVSLFCKTQTTGRVVQINWFKRVLLPEEHFWNPDI